MSFCRRIRLRFVLLAVATAAFSTLLLPDRIALAQAAFSVLLVWTAPGDDGLTGRASRYDLRYSANALAGTDTLSWWNAATVVDMASNGPALAGQPDSMTVGGLAPGRYYAIIRAADEVPNWSGFSNVASFNVGDLIPPRAIPDLRVP